MASARLSEQQAPNLSDELSMDWPLKLVRHNLDHGADQPKTDGMIAGKMGRAVALNAPVLEEGEAVVVVADVKMTDVVDGVARAGEERSEITLELPARNQREVALPTEIMEAQIRRRVVEKSEQDRPIIILRVARKQTVLSGPARRVVTRVSL